MKPHQKLFLLTLALFLTASILALVFLLPRPLADGSSLRVNSIEYRGEAVEPESLDPASQDALVSSLLQIRCYGFTTVNRDAEPVLSITIAMENGEMARIVLGDQSYGQTGGSVRHLSDPDRVLSELEAILSPIPESLTLQR